ncbi:glycosyltransferase [Carnobacterium maltaromaticum]|uniref:glycosyltransferase n=1 Tax=Carnobacterium maltaromaticum TaxID=2751 RepID=UPI003B985995
MNYTIVMVLYEQTLEDSKTFQSLIRYLPVYKNNNNITLLVFDNSVNLVNKVDKKDIDYIYIKNEGNIGLAKSYNQATKYANLMKSEWMLLLDQDTELSKEYFETIFNIKKIPSTVVSCIPQIISNNKIISPILSVGLPKLQNELMEPGTYQDLMAINSASLLKISFLNEIDGFNEEFSLDYLDHWLYLEINKRKKSIQVLDVVIKHELSVMDYNSISVERYQSILNSESNFYTNYSDLPNKVYKNRLILRSFKQFIKVKNKKIAMLTLKKYRKLK